VYILSVEWERYGVEEFVSELIRIIDSTFVEPVIDISRYERGGGPCAKVMQ
jgi:hypothetical protein